MKTPMLLKAVIGLLVFAAFASLIVPIFSAQLNAGLTTFAAILTLAAVLAYVYYTFKLAQFNYLPSASLRLVQYVPPDTIITRNKNYCRFSLECWGNINATVYDKPVPIPGFYGGESPWKLQPFDEHQGVFEISPILAKEGHTMQDMEKSAGQNNYKRQLRFEIDFCYVVPETGIRSSNIKIPYYFDFRSKRLVIDF